MTSWQSASESLKYLSCAFQRIFRRHIATTCRKKSSTTGAQGGGEAGRRVRSKDEGWRSFSVAVLGSSRQSMPRSRLRKTPKRPPLPTDQIFAWAGEWCRAHGRWRYVNSGLIPGTIDGLPRGTRLTLARLLVKRHGVRNSEYTPWLTTARIVQRGQAASPPHRPLADDQERPDPRCARREPSHRHFCR